MPIPILEVRPNRMYLDCSAIDKDFDGLFVDTTNEELETMEKDIAESNRLARFIFKSTWQCIREYDRETIHRVISAEDNERFSTFCQDVALFLVARKVLFGTPYPLIKELMDQAVEDVRKELAKKTNS